MDQERRPRQKLLFTSESGEGRFLTRRTIDQAGLVEDAHRQFVETPRTQSSYLIKILGSCNGLLLIAIDEDLYLSNLTTRRSKKTSLSSPYVTSSSHLTVGGLCFDSSQNDYMVVLAVSHESPGYRDFVTVGSPKKKSWNKNINFPYKVRWTQSGPVLNNILHWCVTDEEKDSWDFPPQHIVYFNPTRFEFVKLPMPEPKGDSNYDSVASLGVLDGCLCMARRINRVANQVDIEILMMKEYGVKESWTFLFKFCGVDYYRGFEPYFYMEKKGHVLLKVKILRQECLLTYDTRRNRRTDTIRPIPVKYFGMVPIVYEETLVEPPTYD